MRMSRKVLGTAMAALVLLVAACSSSGSSAGASSGGGASLAVLTPVKFQLQWVAQSQVAG